jgi:hypothetical protein
MLTFNVVTNVQTGSYDGTVEFVGSGTVTQKMMISIVRTNINSGLVDATIGKDISGIGRVPSEYKSVVFHPQNKMTNLAETFWGCVNLTRCVLPVGLILFPTNLFYGCKKLDHITVPVGVTEMGAHSMYIAKIKTITFLPGSLLTTIGGECFRGSELSEIVLPRSVVTTGQWVFYGSGKLTRITMSKTLWEFLNEGGRNIFSYWFLNDGTGGYANTRDVQREIRFYDDPKTYVTQSDGSIVPGVLPTPVDTTPEDTPDDDDTTPDEDHTTKNLEDSFIETIGSILGATGDERQTRGLIGLIGGGVLLVIVLGLVVRNKTKQKKSS